MRTSILAAVVRRSWCLVALLCGACWLVSASPAPGAWAASAQTPNPNSNYQGCQAFVSDVTVVPGQTITVSGSGADAGDTVTAALERTIGTGVADHNGNFSFSGTIPSTAAAGSQALTVACGPDGGIGTISITIGRADAGSGPITTSGAAPGGGQAPGHVGNGSLPRTGAGNVIPLIKLGVALIALGAVALAVARRRRWEREPALTDQPAPHLGG
ncbi:MAG: hypothetical protein M3Z46_12875 [Actinomycetota bacterium]|nr:hypothetical protein [Actinomycetota bacterium]